MRRLVLAALPVRARIAPTYGRYSRWQEAGKNRREIRRLVLTILLAALLAAAASGLVAAWGSPVLAAGPPGGGTWTDTGAACYTPGGDLGHEMVNTSNGNPHCFKD